MTGSSSTPTRLFKRMGRPSSSSPNLEGDMRSTIESATNGSSSYEEISLKNPLAGIVWACKTDKLISAIAGIANPQSINRFDIVFLLLKPRATSGRGKKVHVIPPNGGPLVLKVFQAAPQTSFNRLHQYTRKKD